MSPMAQDGAPVGWLEGKVAWITGGAAGIGRAVTLRFLQEGARVLVFDRSEAALSALEAEVPKGRAVLLAGDVRAPQDLEEAVRLVRHHFGGLDILVGNAGVFDGFMRLEDIPWSDLGIAYQELFDVNVKGNLLASRCAIPLLKERGGNVIFTVSGASFYPDGGGVLYTASKHAVLGMIRQLAFELAPTVRVNGVAPGGTLTGLKVIPALADRVPALDAEERARRIARRNPMRLAMAPEDHVGAYVLLASEQAKAITGHVIESDGGLAVRGLGPGILDEGA